VLVEKQLFESWGHATELQHVEDEAHILTSHLDEGHWVVHPGRRFMLPFHIEAHMAGLTTAIPNDVLVDGILTQDAHCILCVQMVGDLNYFTLKLNSHVASASIPQLHLLARIDPLHI
jgi:hypothetical protein